MPSQKFYDTIACNWGDGVPAAGSKYLGSRATWLRCTRCDGTEGSEKRICIRIECRRTASKAASPTE
jgi:hypothetical protein